MTLNVSCVSYLFGNRFQAIGSQGILLIPMVEKQIVIMALFVNPVNGSLILSLISSKNKAGLKSSKSVVSSQSNNGTIGGYKFVRHF